MVKRSQKGRFSELKSATASLSICEDFCPVKKSVVFGFSFCCGSRFAIARFARAFFGLLICASVLYPLWHLRHRYTYTCFSMVSIRCRVGNVELLALGLFLKHGRRDWGNVSPKSLASAASSVVGDHRQASFRISAGQGQGRGARQRSALVIRSLIRDRRILWLSTHLTHPAT